MAISEAARADLYTGLAELLGPERAETLMTQLPRFDPDEVATKADMAELRAEFTELRTDFSELRRDINGRLDRMYTTLVAGLFVIVAAMAGVLFTSI